MGNTIHDTASARAPIGLLIVLWLVGWTLRVPILSAPPLATRIADTFGLGEAGIGALTMLPVVTLAFGAIPAAWLIARLGLRTAIVSGIALMALASVARGQVPSAPLLFVVSAVMGLGVSVFQTALPAASRCWTPTHAALGSAVYLNGMMMGEMSGAGLTLPFVLPLAGGHWPTALALWAVPILLIAVLVAIVRVPAKQADVEAAVTVELAKNNALPNLSDRRLWQFSLLFAGSIVVFFVINAFAGTILRARGETEALEELLFFFNATPLAASFTVLLFPKWIGGRAPVLWSALLATAGLAGFVFFTGWGAWAGALLAGYASTVELILLMSLPPAIASGLAVTRLTAGMTLIGFSIGFVLPLVGGWFADQLSWTQMSLIPSLIFAAVVLVFVGRERRYSEYK